MKLDWSGIEYNAQAWTLCSNRGKVLMKRFQEFTVFKNAKYGHCDVKSSAGEDRLLGIWCTKVRSSKRAIKNYDKSIIKLSEDEIRCLTDLGFDWEARLVPISYALFGEHFEELKAFKTKYGHCNVQASTGEHGFLEFSAQG